MKPRIETETSHGDLLKVTEVPDYLKEYCIYSGYRPRLSYKNSIKSLFTFHNESFNIWTHLGGFFFFLYLLIENIMHPVFPLSIDRFAVIIQLITYQICMLNSSLFHLFSCCGNQATHSCWKANDHAGIIIAMLGTYTRIIVNNFHCFLVWRNIHLSIVTLLISATLFLKFFPRRGVSSKSSNSISVPQSSNSISVPLFLAIALYAIAPFSHWVALANRLVHNNVTYYLLAWYVSPYFIGAVGLFFYLSAVPERFVSVGSKINFNILGASHQIWHVFIMTAMAWWYYISYWVYTTRPQSCDLLPL